MFITPFAQKFVSAFLAGCFIAAGILTFGNALIFDRLYIVVLIAIALYVREDINILGVIAILTLHKILEESALMTIEDFSEFKWVLYAACISILFIERKEPCCVYFSATLIVCLAAEFYWYLNDYNAPTTFWHLFQIANALLIRKLLILRPFITAERYPKHAEPIRLDHYIYNLFAIYIWINMFMIVEYIVRHIFGIDSILIFYTSYPYLAHILAVFVLYNLTVQSIKESNKKIFRF